MYRAMVSFVCVYLMIWHRFRFALGLLGLFTCKMMIRHDKTIPGPVRVDFYNRYNVII